MTLKEYYESLGGAYDETISRLGSEDFLKCLVIKFSDDTNFNTLKQALKNKNCEEAFRAVHTLKGLALNLGFTKLSASSIALTEKLRGGSLEDSDKLLEALSEDYEKIISGLKNLE